jgi:hypothetical protein
MEKILKQQQVQNLEEKKKLDISEISPIVGSHIKRIGYLRPIIAGIAMILTTPLFFIFHFIDIVAVYLITPMFNTPKNKFSDSLFIMDRNFKELSIIDKFACAYCGYANGLTVLLNINIDNIETHPDTPYYKSLIVALVGFILFIIGSILTFIAVNLIYNLFISTMLGMKRTSLSSIYMKLKTIGYASNNIPVRGFALRLMKSYLLQISNVLEQIESAWCPIKHPKGIHTGNFPAHHKNFFEHDQIEEMKRILKTKGTVSVIEHNK